MFVVAGVFTAGIVDAEKKGKEKLLYSYSACVKTFSLIGCQLHIY